MIRKTNPEKQPIPHSPVANRKTERKAHKREKQFDPLGSYTGRCENEKEVPTQDADDL